MEKEISRQLFHIFVGLIALGILALFGRGYLIAAVFVVLIIGSLLINFRLLGKKIFFVEWFEKRFERDNVPFSGWGSACYAAGVLLIATFIGNTDKISAAIFVLAIGDAFSTIIGRLGKHPLPYNKNKTVEGLLAFFITSLPAFLFIGPLIIPLAALAAIFESLPLPIDDNITVPIISTLFFLVIK